MALVPLQVLIMMMEVVLNSVRYAAQRLTAHAQKAQGRRRRHSVRNRIGHLINHLGPTMRMVSLQLHTSVPDVQR